MGGIFLSFISCCCVSQAVFIASLLGKEGFTKRLFRQQNRSLQWMKMNWECYWVSLSILHHHPLNMPFLHFQSTAPSHRTLGNKLEGKVYDQEDRSKNQYSFFESFSPSLSQCHSSSTYVFSNSLSAFTPLIFCEKHGKLGYLHQDSLLQLSYFSLAAAAAGPWMWHWSCLVQQHSPLTFYSSFPPYSTVLFLLYADGHEFILKFNMFNK